MKRYPCVYRLESRLSAWGSFSKRNSSDAPSIMRLAMEQWWQPFSPDFSPPPFDLEPNEDGIMHPELDVSCSLSPFVILSEKAVQALHDILTASGQLMPVRTSLPGRQFFGFYPCHPVDCYDSANAFYDTLPTGPLIYDPALKGAALPEEEVFFSIPEDPAFIFFTEVVRRRIEAAGLNGFDFSRAVPVA